MAHTQLATRFLAAVMRDGSPVIFKDVGGTPATYDPDSNTYSGGSAGGNVTGRAVQSNGDPDKFAALGLVLTNPVTLLVAAKDLTIAPAPGMVFEWGGKSYTVVLVEPHSPDDSPIYYSVTGNA